MIIIISLESIINNKENQNKNIDQTWNDIETVFNSGDADYNHLFRRIQGINLIFNPMYSANFGF